MSTNEVMVITGARKGIGRFLAGAYVERGYSVIGCSREPSDFKAPGYSHICLDIADEHAVKDLFVKVRKDYGRCDILINNAGVSSMNHSLLTPGSTVSRILDTNVKGCFMCCREAAKIMQSKRYGRIVNFSTVAVALCLEGEAVYAASKAAIETLTRVLAREFGPMQITINAIGPTPIATDLIKNVPEEKIAALVSRQAIQRLGQFDDVINVIDFFIKPESAFVTGQIIYLGGV